MRLGRADGGVGRGGAVAEAAFLSTSLDIAVCRAKKVISNSILQSHHTLPQTTRGRTRCDSIIACALHLTLIIYGIRAGNIDITFYSIQISVQKHVNIVFFLVLFKMDYV